MANGKYCKSTCIGCIILLCFSSIFFGCFFGIYFPYLRSFSRADCTMIDFFELYTSEDYRGEPHSKYRQLIMSVNIGGENYPGFGCEATSFRDSTLKFDSPDGFWAYEYVDCDSWNSSDRECEEDHEVQGRWLCNQYFSESAFKVGERYDCWWRVNKMFQDQHDVDTTDHFPRRRKSYIEVIFQSEAWYPETEFLVLIVLSLGICCGIPFVFIVFWAVPGIWDFKVYRLTRKGWNFCYRLFRKYVFVCFKFYDPNLMEFDRTTLFLHAAANSKNLMLRKNQSKLILSYLDNDL